MRSRFAKFTVAGSSVVKYAPNGWSPRGFFPPEMCFSMDIVHAVESSGHQWVILSGVACPVAWGRGDPNADAYDDAARRLAGMTDAAGRKLQVVRIPSPGFVEGPEGGPIPASHMNFLIANRAVIVPIYAERPGALAVEALEMLFPDRAVIGLPSSALLTGGGSFHCISQQEPA